MRTRPGYVNPIAFGLKRERSSSAAEDSPGGRDPEGRTKRLLFTDFSFPLRLSSWTAVVLCVLIVRLVAGCSPGRPSESNDQPPPTVAKAVSDRPQDAGTALQTSDQVSEVADPARWAFPPEQDQPWPIRTSREPLAPAKSMNTGDGKGPWPDYRPPKEIHFTPPPIPPRIVEPANKPPTLPAKGDTAG